MKTKTTQKVIGELQNHPRLGKMIQVDFSPLKTCTFNCYYCSLGKTTDMTLDRREFFPPQQIFEAINDWIQQNETPNCLFLTGSGEPALYSKFGELVNLIKKNFPTIQLTAYSNASLFSDPDVRRDFCKLDIMQLNLNAVLPKEFRKINRHHGKVKIENVLEGLQQFKNEFNNPIWIHSVFGTDFNDSEQNIEGLRNFIAYFNPEIYIIRKFDIENKVKPLSNEKTNYIRSQMDLLECKCIYVGFD